MDWLWKLLWFQDPDKRHEDNDDKNIPTSRSGEQRDDSPGSVASDIVQGNYGLRAPVRSFTAPELTCKSSEGQTHPSHALEATRAGDGIQHSQPQVGLSSAGICATVPKHLAGDRISAGNAATTCGSWQSAQATEPAGRVAGIEGNTDDKQHEGSQWQISKDSTGNPSRPTGLKETKDAEVSFDNRFPCGASRPAKLEVNPCGNLSLGIQGKEAGGMPTGNKVGDMDTNCWRRRLNSFHRGSSLPAQNDLDAEGNTRPKSAEFHLELPPDNKRPKSPFKRGHSRSPSDGDKHFLSLLRTSSPKDRLTRESLTSPNPGRSPSFLRRMFGMRKTSTSQEREKDNTEIEKVERRRSQISTDSDQTNNNIVPPKAESSDADMNVRRYLKVPLDDNQQLPMPPIAIFSSDEDISSAPVTPRHYRTVPDSPKTPRKLHGMVSIESQSPVHRTISPALEEKIIQLLQEQPKPSVCHRHSDSDPVSTHEGGSSRNSFDSSESPSHKRPHSSREAHACRYRKYATDKRHHSAEIVDYPGTGSPKSPSRRFTSPSRSRMYQKKRHHTVDLAGIIIHPPEDSKPSSTSVTSHRLDYVGIVGSGIAGPGLTASGIASPGIMGSGIGSPRFCSSPFSPHPTSPASALFCPPPSPTVSSSRSSQHSSPRDSQMSSPRTSYIYPSSPRTSQPPSPATFAYPASPSLGVASDHEEIGERGSTARRSWSRKKGVTPMDLERVISLVHAEVSSTDSGIQQDHHQSSSESLRTPEESTMQVIRRRSSKDSPEKHGRERPKSECLMVRWADSLDRTDQEMSPTRRRLKKTSKDRPKSDLGGGHAISDALEQYELREKFDSIAALPELGGRSDGSRMKTRRMSTPHPIKVRQAHSPPTQARSQMRRVRRSRSAPDLLDKAKKSRRAAFQACSAHAGDLAMTIPVLSDLSSEDEEEISEDTLSLETASETSSITSMGKQAILEEIFEEAQPTYVEALWDHVTMDPEELGFRAGDVIEVTDMNDKDWWWGKLDDREGWFPATFVRLRANQEVTADDFAQKVKDGALDSQAVLRRYSTNLLSKDQARTNVVNEIMHAEREYVKRLKDVVEGYVEKARKRPEMFPDERLWKIFSNIEEIYQFSCSLLKDLDGHFVADAPQLSRVGEVFLRHKRGFEIYSEYCNNHPQACEELKSIQKNKKYMHFFEACRLLQQMIEIPLEGFLLTPVQKICKYPLQLAELLKYTRPEHPDHDNLHIALKTMKSIAMLINERKRKMESMEKLAEWQDRVQDWEGPPLLERSSELIYSGELTKVNSSGWAQDRVFFIFDHQLVYCKKDLLWRDIMIYKGRIDLDHCDIVCVRDGKDSQFNVNVKNGLKVFDHHKEKWYLMYARSPEEKEKWLSAFERERHRVMQDRANGFNLAEYRQKVSGGYARYTSHPDLTDKAAKRKLSRMSYQQAVMKNIPAHVTLPRAISSRESLLYKHPHKKKGWFPFGGRKSKR